MQNRILRGVLATVLLIALQQLAPAQTARQEIEKDPTKAYGVFHLYEYDFPSQTPAPRGYAPFHINHYGRHGARFMEKDTEMNECLRLMKKASENGYLTDSGKELLRKLTAYNAVYSPMTGELTSKGWQQEQVLGPLYAKIYPEIFKAGSGIKAISTAYTRCIMTMSSFCLALQKAVPELEIHEDAGLVYQDELCPHILANPNFRGVAPSESKLYRMDEWNADNLITFASRVVDCKAIIEKYFTDYEFVREWGEPALFCYYLYTIAANAHDTPTEIDFSGIFTSEQWYSLWRVLNYHYYNSYGPRRWTDLPILDHFVLRTDLALSEEKPSALLRFGHDTIISAMLCYLEIGDWSVKAADADHLEDYYRTYRIPMASTLDFVFYKGKKGDVLVKVLLNNVEMPITGLQSVTGPYYRWTDLRARCISVLDEHPVNLK